MTMYLHAGAKPVTYSELWNLWTPEATDTHVPVPHISMVNHAIGAVESFGFQISSEMYGVTKDTNRFFGLLGLHSEQWDYAPSLILRNSHDKSFAMGIGFGSRVFVCDNLAFFADHMVTRKHTSRILDDLQEIITNGTAEVIAKKEEMAHTYDLFKQTSLTDEQAERLIWDMYDRDILNPARVTKVYDQWNLPDRDWDWGTKTAWRLFNAATYTLSGRVTENPKGTMLLTSLIKEACPV